MRMRAAFYDHRRGMKMKVAKDDVVIMPKGIIIWLVQHQMPRNHSHLVRLGHDETGSYQNRIVNNNLTLVVMIKIIMQECL